MKTTIDNFYKKWNGVDCEDWGGVMSPMYQEYHLQGLGCNHREQDQRTLL